MSKYLRKYDELAEKIKKEQYSFEAFLDELGKFTDLFTGKEGVYQYILAAGMPIVVDDGIVALQTSKTNYQQEIFCFIDIETTGSNPNNSQLIEVAAIKWQNGKVLDVFESLVFCNEVPPHITEITQIATEDLIGAPSEKETLLRFKKFLDGAVFVAHNVDFDFGFLSRSLEKFDYGRLLNRRLCTIDLAKKSIYSERYGLRHLRELLELPDIGHHRAYSDSLNALKIFEICLKNIPEEIVTTEELLEFSKIAPKKEPPAEEEDLEQIDEKL